MPFLAAILSLPRHHIKPASGVFRFGGEISGWLCKQSYNENQEILYRYFFDKEGRTEAYLSEYTDYLGRDNETANDVINSLVVIINDKAIRENVIDWIIEDGVSQALEKPNQDILTEIEGVYVSILLTSINLKFSICSGDNCESIPPIGKNIFSLSKPKNSNLNSKSIRRYRNIHLCSDK